MTAINQSQNTIVELRTPSKKKKQKNVSTLEPNEAENFSTQNDLF